MLINVSRFVSVQKQVRDFVSEQQKRIMLAVKANYAKPTPQVETDAHMRRLREVCEQELSSCGYNWP